MGTSAQVGKSARGGLAMQWTRLCRNPAVGETTTAMSYRDKRANRRGSRPAAPWLKWNVNSGALSLRNKHQIANHKSQTMTKSQIQITHGSGGSVLSR